MVSKTKVSNEYTIFVLLTIIYILTCFQSVSPIAITGSLMDDLQLNATQLGIISSVCFLSYALIQPVIGFLTDKFGASKLIIVSFMMIAISSLLFGASKDFQSAVFARTMIGFGMGGIFIPASKMIAELFKADRYTKFNGLFIGIGGATGTVLATVPMAWLDILIGWNNVFYIYSVLGIFIILASLFIFPVNKKGASTFQNDLTEKINYPETMKKLIFSRNFFIIEIIFFTSFGVYLSFQGLWATKYLTSVLGIHQQTANSLIIALPVGLLIGSMIAGYLSDKVFNSRMIPLRAALTILLVCWSLMTFFTSHLHTAFLLLIFLFTGIAIGLITPIVFSAISDIVPPEAMGLSLGLINPSSLVGIFAFQILTSVILDYFMVNNNYTSYTYFMMMLFCTISLLIITTLSFLLKETMAKNFDQKPLLAYSSLRIIPYNYLNVFTRKKHFKPGVNKYFSFLSAAFKHKLTLKP